MELLERYLLEIRRDLGEQGDQDDLIAEVSDDVQSQIEAREAELGRPLAADEEAAIIASYGHPRAVAARFRTPRYLIGPLLFPFYAYVVKVVVLAVVILDLAGSTIAALVSPAQFDTFLQGVGVLWQALLYSVVCVTLMFAVAEHFGAGESIMESIKRRPWDPRELPAIHGEELSPAALLFEAFVTAGGAIWFFGIPAVRANLGLAGAASASSQSAVTFAPAWHPFFIMVLIATAAIVIVDAVLAIRPALTRVRALVLAIVYATYTAAAIFVLTAGPGVRVSLAGASAASQPAMNVIVLSLLAALGLICIVQTASNLRVLFRRQPEPALNIAPTLHA